MATISNRASPGSAFTAVGHRLLFDRLPKAVLFDNDGVVLDSEPLIFQATAQVFAQHGIQLQREDVQEGIGAGAKYVSDPVQKYGLATVAIDELMRDREATFRRLAPGQLKPFPGFHALADFLKRLGVRVALASSASTEVVVHNLGLAGVDLAIFDVIVDSSKILQKKPAPDIFLAGAACLSMDPGDCLVIEDAPPGIQAAKNAQMAVVAVTTSFPPERLQAADIVVRSLEDIHREFAARFGTAVEV